MRYDIFNNCFVELDVTPNKLAICGSDRDLTWIEFYNSVQSYISIYKELSIPVGHPIMIIGHKEACFPAAMTAAMLCNIIYIPVDTIIPPERIARIKEISGSQIVIKCTDEVLTGSDFAIEIGPNNIVKKRTTPNYIKNVYYREKDPIRYIIFTSGSTGEPKGVQITSEALCSFADWMMKDFGLQKDDVYINQAPFSFDLSVYEYTCFLVMGSTLLLNTNAIMLDHESFLKRIKKYSGSVWVSTPSFAYLYLRDEIFNKSDLPSIKIFLFCGETLPDTTAKSLLRNFSNSKVLNTYGPTEATVATTLIEITPEIAEKYTSLPVGYSKPNSALLIENLEHNQSEPGEIIIIGENVSIGYLNKPELTNERFFVHNGQRSYKTGDIGFIKEDILFYLGRNDDQVKLHGYRIELEEISAHIRNFDFITDAVTIPLKKGEEVKRIVTFVISSANCNLNELQIKEKIIAKLTEKLPPYMIPSDIRTIISFPYSNNHKIDKKQLTTIYMNR